ncbi:uncharacterized protein A4U43_C01F16490 [Asparagus officinalis]|uniref:Uncharacterized protein n=1 Tax=Asparagus officinalis TaxID=4686 RepID=A0A5P1FQN3_ASPOF|nr:uncharacterized protein LOC109824285 [Asparagus officinalis]ONK80334.1 uncharacterized protein A4U43_C01F16490 [Asparagus officinalis]
MEVYGSSMVVEHSNVIFLSTILNRDGPIPIHKCDSKCQNEHIFGNMYHCKLTGITHICDKNCTQRILYDNHSSLCRVSGQIFPLSPVEEQAVRGLRRKLEIASTDGCARKRRRDAQLHPSPFERSFSAVSPICSQVGDGMNMN